MPSHAEAQRALGLLAPPLARAAGEVKSTGEPVPIHQRATNGSPSASRTKCRRARRRRSWAPARGAGARDSGSGGHWPSTRLEVDPRRDPHDRAHAVCAQARDHPREVRELVRVGLPGVVLRLPRRVEHDRVERDAVARGSRRSRPRRRPGARRRRGSSSTRRPTRAARGGRPVRRRKRAQPRGGRRVGEQVQAQRPGRARASRRRPRRRGRSARRGRGLDPAA